MAPAPKLYDDLLALRHRLMAIVKEMNSCLANKRFVTSPEYRALKDEYHRTKLEIRGLIEQRPGY